MQGDAARGTAAREERNMRAPGSTHAFNTKLETAYFGDSCIRMPWWHSIEELI